MFDSLPVHGIFQQRFRGDESLLNLARLRFAQAGLAAEVHGETHDELERLVRIAPTAVPPMIHLDRGLNILDPQFLHTVTHLMRRFDGRVTGFVVHDNGNLPSRLDELAVVGEELDRSLAAYSDSTASVFIEYAVGYEIEDFIKIGHRLHESNRVSLCIDIGHVGVREARRFLSKPHLAIDTPKSSDSAPSSMVASDLRCAIVAARAAVRQLTASLAALGKPLHYHLHDGNPFISGLPDHFSFLHKLPISPVIGAEEQSLARLYGPTGVTEIIEDALEASDGSPVSFTLEIHQVEGQLPLGDDVAHLFEHWKDTTNAERMNYWLSILSDNATLVDGIIRKAWQDHQS